MKLPKIDGFIYLLLGAIVLAKLWTWIGWEYEWFGWLAHWGVSVVFFFYGLKLTPDKFRAGLSNVRLHVVIQLATFVLFPLIVWGAMALAGPAATPQNELLWLGVMFVAALPSTVSSSVVMVSIARGNIPAAIFNASLSSLIGVFITPLWMSLIMSLDGQMAGRGLIDMMLGLVVQVIVPIGVGMLLCRKWGAWAVRHGRMLKNFDQTVILLIVFVSFCESFEGGMFDGIKWSTHVGIIVGMLALFGVAYWLMNVVCKWLKFNREDRITALFCGSKKSLVHGTVMSKVIFQNASSVGVILLPIMIYHALQLVVVSVLAERFQRTADIKQ